MNKIKNVVPMIILVYKYYFMMILAYRPNLIEADKKSNIIVFMKILMITLTWFLVGILYFIFSGTDTEFKVFIFAKINEDFTNRYGNITDIWDSYRQTLNL